MTENPKTLHGPEFWDALRRFLANSPSISPDVHSALQRELDEYDSRLCQLLLLADELGYWVRAYRR